MCASLHQKDYVELNCCFNIFETLQEILYNHFSYIPKCNYLCVNKTCTDIATLLCNYEILCKKLNYLYLSKFCLPNGFQLLLLCKNISTFVVDITYTTNDQSQYIIAQCNNLNRPFCITQINNNLYLHSTDIMFDDICIHVDFNSDFCLFDNQRYFCGKKQYQGSDILNIQNDIFKIYLRRFK
ncbi:hypothetical protein [Neodiprion abietis nucleopolyhedrovirus]|uniref:Uncharacterized protein n=1 Tax=Neodiprion abietis nucleopolyhedrovirus TaxID=204507 RepID=Q0ZP05_9CBAC|nr:hypothetical protein [Neodiprion abietis nucleopolyhedrovirus]ABC74949.1 unknown [Neodiprion abietis nucleopolyhedrovirus]